jgi:hypothetical protein
MTDRDTKPENDAAEIEERRQEYYDCYFGPQAMRELDDARWGVE